MRILPITQQISFRKNKYVHDVKNKSYALREFVEHTDLEKIGDKSEKVIEK